MNAPELNQFAKQGFNRVALLAESLVADETPLSLYLKLTQKSGQKNTYLLESVYGGGALVVTRLLAYQHALY